MPEDRKPKPAAHPPESSMFSLVSGLLRQGVEAFFTSQRILMDLISKQNASAMKALRQRWFGSREARTSLLTELMRDGMSNFVEAQKVLLNLAQRENELVLTGVKERVSSPLIIAMTDLARRSVDTLIDMQQHFLGMASKHTEGWLDAVKAGKAYTGDGLKQLSREGIDTFMKAQKKLLDVLLEETTHATSGKHALAAKGKKTELAQLAQQATDSFIEAQKRLLDVAGRQVHSNLKTASRAVSMVKPFSLVSFAELSREVVKSYVEAQKALLDAMVKPRAAAPHPVRKPARRVRRPARARKAPVMAAQAAT